MSIEDEALATVGRWIEATKFRDHIVVAMQEGRLPEDDAQGTKAICDLHAAEKGLRAFWALYGVKGARTQIAADEDQKLTNLALGLLSRAYELEIGKDITREKLVMHFVGKPELENLKAAIAAFFREAIRDHH